jgi:hypothetical protein
MKWFAKLNGNETDLEVLSKDFASDEVRIRKERKDCGSYILESSYFNDMDDPLIVYHKACELVKKIGVVKILLHNLHSDLLVSEIACIQNKKRHKYTFGSLDIELPPVKLSILGHSEPEGSQVHKEDTPGEYLNLIQEHDTARDISELIEAGGLKDWPGLYLIYEKIQEGIGGALSKKGWISTRTEESFTMSAQEHRHSANCKKPAWGKAKLKPMPFSEARALIIHIANKYLNSLRSKP